MQIKFPTPDSAASTDGNFETNTTQDSAGSYVRIRAEFAGLASNTPSGMYSIYLPFPADAPEHLVAQARDFKSAVRAALKAQKLAEELAKRDAAKAQDEATSRLEAEAIASAMQSGQPIVIRSYSARCDGSVCECNLDIISIVALPNGSTTKRRTHTF